MLGKRSPNMHTIHLMKALCLTPCNILIYEQFWQASRIWKFSQEADHLRISYFGWKIIKNQVKEEKMKKQGGMFSLAIDRKYCARRDSRHHFRGSRIHGMTSRPQFREKREGISSFFISSSSPPSGHSRLFCGIFFCPCSFFLCCVSNDREKRCSVINHKKGFSG